MTAATMNRTCYDCQNHRVCGLRRDADEMILRNLHHIDVDVPSGSEKSFIRIFDTLGAICTQFKVNP